MSTYLLIPLVQVVFGFVLLMTLSFGGRQHIARRPFAIFLFFMTLWGFMLFMMRTTSTDMETAAIWEKMVFWSILSAAIFFFKFIMTFTGTRPSRFFTYSLYITYIAVMILIPTEYILAGIRPLWFGVAPQVGVLFPLYVLCVSVPIAWGAAVLIKYLQSTHNIDERVRTQYILAGIAVMAVGMIIDYFIALGFKLYPVGIIGNLLFCLIATIAMLRHNLLDMQVVFRRGLSYSMAAMLLFALFGSLIYFLSYYSQDFISPVSITMTIVAIFLTALLFQPVLTRLQRTVDRWFYRGRYDQIQVLKQFTREARSSLNLEQLSAALVETVVSGLGCRGVYLLLPLPTTGNYITYTYAGQRNRGRVTFPATSPLVTGMAQQTGIVDCYNMNTALADSVPSRDLNVLENNGIELIVPLRSNSHLAGMLLLANKTTSEPYSKEDRQLLEKVSVNIASSLENANDYENIKQKHNELEKAMEGIIHAVSLVVGSRDPYTASHQRRVAELALCIAKEMGLSEWQSKGVFIAGLLHDVGKVAVPSDILNKPGRINTNEYEIIKNHSRVGYEILQRIDFPWPVTRAILQHHERLDGSGYPDGLTGDEIIIEAKILGVADVIEAMSSHRPYRPARGLQIALDEVKRGRGTLYDPEVVDISVKLLAKNTIKFDRIMEAAEVSEGMLLKTVI